MRVDIKTGYSCNNNCIFCVQGDNKSKGNRSLDVIKKDIDNSEFEEIVFTGGECTIRDDFFEMVSYAKQKGFKKIQIQSNGRAFSYLDFCRKAVKSGANEFAFSIHGSNSELHDSLTQVKGSFDQVVKAIQNLKALGCTVITNTVIVNDNYENLPLIADLLVSLKVDHFQLAFVHQIGGGSSIKIPRMSSVIGYVKEALQIGLDNGVEVRTEAIPYCLLDGYENCVAEEKTPFTQVKDGEVIEDFVALRKKECKQKFSQCSFCRYDYICEGPWKEYPEMFGSSEFSDKPNEVNIELLNKCNLDCDFCFNSKNDEVLEKSKVFKVINQIDEAGWKAIRFTGGEPLLREDLFEIVKYAKEKGLHVILNTNGLLIKDYKLFEYVDQVLVSFHGLDKKEKIKEIVFNLPGKVMLSTIAVKKNIFRLEEFFSFVKDLDVCWFLLRPVQGEFLSNTAERLIELNKKYGMNVIIANSVPFCMDDKIKEVCVGGINDEGRSRIVVDSSGRIKPSYFSELKLGKIDENKLVDCWNSDYMIKQRRNENLNVSCVDCVDKQVCMGGLTKDILRVN